MRCPLHALISVSQTTSRLWCLHVCFHLLTLAGPTVTHEALLFLHRVALHHPIAPCSAENTGSFPFFSTHLKAFQTFSAARSVTKGSFTCVQYFLTALSILPDLTLLLFCTGKTILMIFDCHLFTFRIPACDQLQLTRAFPSSCTKV